MNFNSRSVTKIIGIKTRQLDYWDSTHIVKPSVREAAGYGSVRLYSFNDLVQLKVVKTLRDKGISLQKIRKALNYLSKNMPEIQKPLAELKFLTDGETIFVITRNKKKILDTLKNQFVFSFALGEMMEELKGEVVALEREKKYKVKVRGRNYNVVLHPDTEDGGYWIECPRLPGCVSQGDTIEEALAMIKDAIEGHLQVIEEEKKLKKAS